MTTEEIQRTYLQYENAHNYFEHRGLKPDDQIMSIKNFERKILEDSFVSVSDSNSGIKLILTLPGRKFSNIDTQMESKIKSIIKATKYKLHEIIYIVDPSFVEGTAYNNMLKYTKKLSTEFPEIWFQIRPRSILYFNIPLCSAVPTHERIPDQAAIKETLTRDYIELSDLPGIKEFDPGCFWEGARAGEIIKIYRYSRIVVEIDIYRKVVL